MRFDVSDLAGFQRDFLGAITAQPRSHPGLKIHHDTWFFGLIDSLVSVYPATAAVLGDEAFKAFARDYVRAEPLRSGNRSGYGADFADFLARHPHLPIDWLPSLAHYEYALHAAHGADDAEAADFDALLDPEARVAFHPSVRIIPSNHDIKAAHAAAVAKTEVPPVPLIACTWLIGRTPDDTIVELSLTQGEAEFAARIASENTLSAALDALDPTENEMQRLQHLLAALVRHGLLITL